MKWHQSRALRFPEDNIDARSLLQALLMGTECHERLEWHDS